MSTNGEIYEIERFIKFRWYTWDSYGSMNNSKSTLKYSFTPEGDVREIHVMDIAEITFINGHDKLYLKTRTGLKENVYLRMRTSFEFSGFEDVEYFDRMTGEIKRRKFAWEDIKRVTFDNAIGNMKLNPITDDVYPVEFVYDPYTGDKLRLYDPKSGEISGNNTSLQDEETAESQESTEVIDDQFEEEEETHKVNVITTTPLTHIINPSSKQTSITLRGNGISKTKNKGTKTGASPVQAFFNVPTGTYQVILEWGDNIHTTEIEVNEDKNVSINFTI